MTQKTDKRPDCFGVLDLVFPMGEEGLRQSPDGCMACELKTECLRTAIGRPAGGAVEEERVDRAYQSGTIRFLERWARKKSLYYRRRDCQSEGKTK